MVAGETRHCVSCGQTAEPGWTFCSNCGSQLLPNVPAMSGGLRLASFPYRLSGALIDSLLFFAIGPIILLFEVVGAATLGGLLASAALIGYPLVGNATGGTFGKRLLGLRVIKADGQTPGARAGTVRYVMMFISAIPLYLGYLWVLWDAQKQAWHDKAAGTFVVRLSI